METDELPNVDMNVDYEAILPIQQKRTITFINNFITNTVSFLNTFSQSCESRLLEFEYKMQKIEASLLILESQLSSIPDINKSDNSSLLKSSSNQEEQKSLMELPEIARDSEINVSQNDTSKGVVASQDPRFTKFFNMIKVRVPSQAVKNQMALEGVDPSILDKPNEVIPGTSAGINLSNVNSDT